MGIERGGEYWVQEDARGLRRYAASAQRRATDVLCVWGGTTGPAPLQATKLIGLSAPSVTLSAVAKHFAQEESPHSQRVAMPTTNNYYETDPCVAGRCNSVHRGSSTGAECSSISMSVLSHFRKRASKTERKPHQTYYDYIKTIPLCICYDTTDQCIPEAAVCPAKNSNHPSLKLRHPSRSAALPRPLYTFTRTKTSI